MDSILQPEEKPIDQMQSKCYLEITHLNCLANAKANTRYRCKQRCLSSYSAKNNSKSEPRF